MKGAFSKLVLLLIALFFLFDFGGKMADAASGEKTCFQAYDGFGYYMYLPHLFEKGHLNISSEWAEKRQQKYCPGVTMHQLIRQPNGNNINAYHMGLALVELPSYTIGEAAARIGNFPRDGMSKPYHIAFLCNAFLFALIGLIVVRKTLLLYFNDVHTGIVLLLLYGASNIYITFSESFQLQHLYLFTLNAVFLYYLLRYVREKKQSQLIISALMFGLGCFIRPTQVFWGILPVVLLFENHRLLWPLFKRLIWFPIFAFLFNIPHFIYWKLVGDSWLLPNLHTEDIVLSDPNLSSFLFSFKKGWLLYTPLFLLLVPGFIFLYRSQKRLFYAALGYTCINIYVLSSWECWWYAASYSARVLVDCYPLFALVLAFAIRGLMSHRILKYATAAFALLCVLINIIQSVQFKRGYLHYERMTQEQYAYIFGNMNIPDYHPFFLEIDRGDNAWPEHPFYASPENGFHVVQTHLYHTQQAMTVEPVSDAAVTRIPILTYVKTDETLLEITIRCSSSDTSVNSFLQLQMLSEYNTYSWNSVELSQHQPSDSLYTVKYRFNLPPVRHKKDELNIYVNNPNPTKLYIDTLYIDAYTLVRE